MLPAGWEWGPSVDGLPRVATWKLAAGYSLHVRRDRAVWQWWLVHAESSLLGVSTIVAGDDLPLPHWTLAEDACVAAESRGVAAMHRHRTTGKVAV